MECPEERKEDILNDEMHQSQEDFITIGADYAELSRIADADLIVNSYEPAEDDN